MNDIWRSLAINVVVMALFVSGWTHLNSVLQRRRTWVREAGLGAVMGAGAIASMMLSVEVQPGIFFDLRSAFVVIGGYFGGPIGGALAMASAAGYRLHLGGSGAIPGLVGIGMAGLLGQFGNLLTGATRPHIELLVLSVATGAMNLALMAMLPGPIMSDAYAQFGLPIGVLSGAAAVVAGWVISRDRAASEKRALLSAALAQASDYHYIKDAQSRFVAVNNQVAAHNGFATPEAMVGKSDFDLVPAERARRLFEQERRILRLGEAVDDIEERIVDSTGEEKWFATSKVPLRAADGTIIGLAGVTRDVTERRRNDLELTDSRDLLSYLMDEMSAGLAMFNRDGVLTFCSEHYRSIFPRTAHIRHVGAHIRDILWEVVRTGEQLGVEEDGGRTWVEAVTAGLRIGGEEQVELYDGRWLQISTRPTQTGASLVVVSDVTSIKQSEWALLKLTDQLKVMATTDTLTGLMNRRAFDARLRRELRRTEAAKAPISLLMIDVDRFKAYNDRYGHLAGDECLKSVGQCLSSAVREADIVARFGGEEFVAILPEAEERDALAAAERFVLTLRGKGMLHAASQHAVVTASVGVSNYSGDSVGRTGKELLEKADEALYQAKAAGRDQVVCWGERDAVTWAG